MKKIYLYYKQVPLSRFMLRFAIIEPINTVVLSFSAAYLTGAVLLFFGIMLGTNKPCSYNLETAPILSILILIIALFIFRKQPEETRFYVFQKTLLAVVAGSAICLISLFLQYFLLIPV